MKYTVIISSSIVPEKYLVFNIEAISSKSAEFYLQTKYKKIFDNIKVVENTIELHYLQSRIKTISLEEFNKIYYNEIETIINNDYIIRSKIRDTQLKLDKDNQNQALIQELKNLNKELLNYRTKFKII